MLACLSFQVYWKVFKDLVKIRIQNLEAGSGFASLKFGSATPIVRQCPLPSSWIELVYENAKQDKKRRRKINCLEIWICSEKKLQLVSDDNCKHGDKLTITNLQLVLNTLNVKNTLKHSIRKISKWAFTNSW